MKYTILRKERIRKAGPISSVNIGTYSTCASARQKAAYYFHVYKFVSSLLYSVQFEVRNSVGQIVYKTNEKIQFT